MGRPTEDLTGQRFGKLVAVTRSSQRHGHAYWTCRCDCGAVGAVTSSALRNGITTNCGCAAGRPPFIKRPRETTRSARHKATYQCWWQMVARTSDPDHPAWPNYGGRGITVCTRWLDFANFLADMGEQPLGKSLDRIDNSLGYSPGNCRWVTPRTQARNTRSFKLTAERVTEVIRLDEEGIGIVQLAASVGLSEKTARTVLVMAAAFEAAGWQRPSSAPHHEDCDCDGCMTFRIERDVEWSP